MIKVLTDLVSDKLVIEVTILAIAISKRFKKTGVEIETGWCDEAALSQDSRLWLSVYWFWGADGLGGAM